MLSIRSLLQSTAFASLLWHAASAQNSTTTTTQASTSSVACNNSPALCSKSYGNITHLGAHDSAFVSNSSNSYTSSGNQYYDTPTQLSAGVRLVSAQVHQTNTTSGTEWHLCHTSCDLFDAGKLSDWLASIKTWMDSNSNEVVTILLVNSDDMTASELHSEYTTAGLVDMSYTPTSQTTAPTTWPTLDELISNGTRVMNFVASLDASSNTVAPYLMDEFTFLFENPYSVTDSANFSCTPDRPTSLSGSTTKAASSNMLFMMNHFLDEAQAFGIQTPNTEQLTTTNNASTTTVGALGYSAAQCSTTYSSAPNFLLVDYFNVGSAIDTADNLNGVAGSTTGRTSLATTVAQVKASASSTSGASHGKSAGASGSAFAAVIAFTVAVLAGSW